MLQKTYLPHFFPEIPLSRLQSVVRDIVTNEQSGNPTLCMGNLSLYCRPSFHVLIFKKSVDFPYRKYHSKSTVYSANVIISYSTMAVLYIDDGNLWASIYWTPKTQWPTLSFPLCSLVLASGLWYLKLGNSPVSSRQISGISVQTDAVQYINSPDTTPDDVVMMLTAIFGRVNSRGVSYGARCSRVGQMVSKSSQASDTFRAR